LPARIRGTLKVSGTPGDKLALKFQGTGVELIGDTGSDRGIASIRLDGRELGTTDAFVPENRYSISAHPSLIREPWNIATEPPIRLWGIEDLDDREHLLEVVVSGRKNKESTGTFIGVDAIVILNGSPVGPSPRK
jgi:hypothetical protein